MTLRALRKIGGRLLAPLAALLLSACGGYVIPVAPVAVTPSPVVAPVKVPAITAPPEAPKRLLGWQKPYTVDGKRYMPLLYHRGFVQEGRASWYGEDFHGKKTSNGEIYDMHAMTAAHKTLPLGVWVKVVNRSNGKEAIVRVNDRGPFVKERIIDLSYTAAKKLDVVGPGTAPVRIEALGYRSAGETAYRAQPDHERGTFTVQVGSFGVAENARSLASELETRHGFSDIEETQVGGTTYYRVRAGKYPSLSAAETARESFAAGGYRSSIVVAMD